MSPLLPLLALGQVRLRATSAVGHQLTLTRHFGLTKLTPSLQIDLTKIHCVHLRYSILARHQIAAEPACRFLQPRRRLGRDGSLFVIRRSSLAEAESAAATVNAVHQQQKGIRSRLSVLCNLPILG